MTDSSLEMTFEVLVAKQQRLLITCEEMKECGLDDDVPYIEYRIQLLETMKEQIADACNVDVTEFLIEVDDTGTTDEDPAN